MAVNERAAGEALAAALMVALGEQLARERARAGWSRPRAVQMFADRVGLHTTVASLRTNENQASGDARDFTMRKFLLMCVTYGVSPSALLLEAEVQAHKGVYCDEQIQGR